MLRPYLFKVSNSEALTRAEAAAAMQCMMSGESSEAQMGAFLTAMKMKGVTSEEVAGFATTMRANCQTIECRAAAAVDTCGTGGDGKGTFNVSTAAALVAAGAGATIAKHGNRGISSACGSADVLRELGVAVDLPPAAAGQLLDEIGIGFLYAPLFHPAMRHAAKPRQELAFRTIFNLLGPLTNPVRAKRQVLGVYAPELTETVAAALQATGTVRAMVVHSEDGLDEISTAAATKITEVTAQGLQSYRLNPAEYGFAPCVTADYRGGTPAENAQLIRGILAGQPGPKRDIVVLNAAAALVVGGQAANLAAGIRQAADSIDHGAALAVLAMLQDGSQRLKQEGLLS